MTSLSECPIGAEKEGISSNLEVQGLPIFLKSNLLIVCFKSSLFVQLFFFDCSFHQLLREGCLNPFILVVG